MCEEGNGPGRLVLKPVVQDSARSPEQPLPGAQKAARSGWRTSCVKFPESPQERNVKGVGGTVRLSGHVRTPPHVQGTHRETGMFLLSGSPTCWGRPAKQTSICTILGRRWGRWGQLHPQGRGEAAQRSPGSELSFEGAEAVKRGRVAVAGRSKREQGHVLEDAAEGPGMSSLERKTARGRLRVVPEGAWLLQAAGWTAPGADGGSDQGGRLQGRGGKER